MRQDEPDVRRGQSAMPAAGLRTCLLWCRARQQPHVHRVCPPAAHTTFLGALLIEAPLSRCQRASRRHATPCPAKRRPESRQCETNLRSGQARRLDRRQACGSTTRRTEPRIRRGSAQAARPARRSSLATVATPRCADSIHTLPAESRREEQASALTWSCSLTDRA